VGSELLAALLGVQTVLEPVPVVLSRVGPELLEARRQVRALLLLLLLTGMPGARLDAELRCCFWRGAGHGLIWVVGFVDHVLPLLLLLLLVVVAVVAPQCWALLQLGLLRTEQFCCSCCTALSCAAAAAAAGPEHKAPAGGSSQLAGTLQHSTAQHEQRQFLVPVSAAVVVTIHAYGPPPPPPPGYMSVVSISRYKQKQWGRCLTVTTAQCLFF
jgi:hypothetical protein